MIKVVVKNRIPKETQKIKIGFDDMYSALDVAKYIVAYCTQQGVPIGNIKLQKILYFLFGEFYVKTRTILFPDTFQAWQYGPVVASVYNEFAVYGGAYICLLPNDYEEIHKRIDPSNQRIFNDIINKYVAKGTFELVEISHEKGRAWSRIVEKNGGYENQPEIPHDEILKDFKEDE